MLHSDLCAENRDKSNIANADYIDVPISQDNFVDYSIFASFKGLSLPIFLELIYL